MNSLFSPPGLGPYLRAALPLVVAHALLLFLFDLAARPVATIAVCAAAMLALPLAVRALGGLARVQTTGILAVAVLLRALLLPLPASLSEDVLRYVWDGKVAAAGQNPYLLAPNAPVLEPLRDSRWEQMPHRQVPTVYPPLALTIFSIAARLPAPVLALKILLVFLDLVTCWLLLRIANSRAIPAERVAWYAWNPLVALEIAGMGHVDALGVAAVVATVFWLSRPQSATAWAAVGAAAAVLAKLVPIAAVPVWTRHSRRPLVFLAVAATLVAIAMAPVVWTTGGAPPGMVEFGVSWEFNGPLYEPLWRGLDAMGVQDMVALRLDRYKQRSGRHDLVNRLYPYNYPQLLAKLLLAAALLVALISLWREPDPLVATGKTFGRILIFSATVYPWYVLWVLPWAALTRQPAWILLSALLPLAYLPQLTTLDLYPWVFAAIWIPFAALLAWRPRWSFD